MAAATARREFNASTFEYLNVEMVRYAHSAAPAGDDEHVFRTLERQGFSVGQRLAELYAKDRQRFASTLDVMKFVRTEFWHEVYAKKADKMKTNHRGVYVLEDECFRWLAHMSPRTGAGDGGVSGASAVGGVGSGAGASAAGSSSTAAATASGASPVQPAAAAESGAAAGAGAAMSAEDTLAMAAKHLIFPCGVLRGVLTAFGVDCAVSASVKALPACTFTVRIK